MTAPGSVCFTISTSKSLELLDRQSTHGFLLSIRKNSTGRMNPKGRVNTWLGRMYQNCPEQEIDIIASWRICEKENKLVTSIFSLKTDPQTLSPTWTLLETLLSSLALVSYRPCTGVASIINYQSFQEDIFCVLRITLEPKAQEPAKDCLEKQA